MAICAKLIRFFKKDRAILKAINMRSDIVLRLATKEDSDLLLEWRNDGETRKESHNTRQIGPDEHAAWLARSLDDRNRKLLIAEENGVPVGTVRADFLQGEWEMSWTVSPAARRRGLAKRMVFLFASQISEPIRAEVKVGNIASARVAESAGMVLVENASGVLYYRRPAIRDTLQPQGFA